MKRRRAPLLWGGCFLFLVLILLFTSGEFYLPNPVGVKILQALGVSYLQSPQVVWEYRPRTGDVLLPYWDEGGFSPLKGWEATGKALALDVEGRELWQRELPGEVRVKALGANWAATNYASKEIFFYHADGRLAWQQRWTWPLQEVFLSPQGEVAVFLGPLWGEGINHLEKLVWVNKEGRTVWEYPLRNGTILQGTFDGKGEHFALTGLFFHQDGMENRALLLNQRGEICGEFTSPGEEIFLATALGQGIWFLAGPRALYGLDYSGTGGWQYFFDRQIQRLLSDVVQGGVMAITWAEGGSGAGSILSYLNREGELAWEHSFCTPADKLQLAATQRGIIVGDSEGMYGLGYNGDINWYYSFSHTVGLFADPQGKRLLVAGADGVLTLFSLPE